MIPACNSYICHMLLLIIDVLARIPAGGSRYGTPYDSMSGLTAEQQLGFIFVGLVFLLTIIVLVKSDWPHNQKKQRKK